MENNQGFGYNIVLVGLPRIVILNMNLYNSAYICAMKLCGLFDHNDVLIRLELVVVGPQTINRDMGQGDDLLSSLFLHNLFSLLLVTIANHALDHLAIDLGILSLFFQLVLPNTSKRQ